MVTDRDWQKYLNKSLVFVAYASRTEHELSMRLRKYLASSDLQEDDKEQLERKIIEYLKKLGFIDDKKFLHDFINSARFSRKPFNKRTLRLKLKQKGFTSEVIDLALSTFSFDDELNSALNILNIKTKNRAKPSLEDSKQMQALYSFLLSKGFDWDTCRLAVDSWLKLK